MPSARALLPALLLLASPAGAQHAQSVVSETSVPEPVAEPASSWRDLCDPPYIVDAAGIRRVVLECLSVPPSVPTAAFPLLPAYSPVSIAACEPPYHIDTRGIRRLIPACLTLELPAPLPALALAAVPATFPPPPSCEPPYYIDKAGIRRLKRECL